MAYDATQHRDSRPFYTTSVVLSHFQLIESTYMTRTCRGILTVDGPKAPMLIAKRIIEAVFCPCLSGEGSHEDAQLFQAETPTASIITACVGSTEPLAETLVEELSRKLPEVGFTLAAGTLFNGECGIVTYRAGKITSLHNVEPDSAVVLHYEPREGEAKARVDAAPGSHDELFASGADALSHAAGLTSTAAPPADVVGEDSATPALRCIAEQHLNLAWRQISDALVTQRDLRETPWRSKGPSADEHLEHVEIITMTVDWTDQCHLERLVARHKVREMRLAARCQAVAELENAWDACGALLSEQLLNDSERQALSQVQAVLGSALGTFNLLDIEPLDNGVA